MFGFFWSILVNLQRELGYSRKKKKKNGVGGGWGGEGTWGHEISRGIKEIACGISRG